MMLFAIWKFFHSKEYSEVLFLQTQVVAFLKNARQEFTGEWEYFKLQNKMNEMIHKAGINHAWGNKVFNPRLGVTYKAVGNQLIRVSVGLRKDRFMSPCAIFYIVDDGE
jgi:hypothetical protein